MDDQTAEQIFEGALREIEDILGPGGRRGDLPICQEIRAIVKIAFKEAGREP